MTNEQMKAGRFLKLFQAKQKLAGILSHLNAGGKVLVATYTKATQFDKRHTGMFKATKGGLLMQRGKAWECIDYCAIRFSRGGIMRERLEEILAAMCAYHEIDGVPDKDARQRTSDQYTVAIMNLRSLIATL